jgi:hypothetical protein
MGKYWKCVKKEVSALFLYFYSLNTLPAAIKYNQLKAGLQCASCNSLCMHP